jgi:NADPH:quinone reductase
VRTGSLLRHSRSVVGFYLFHCLRRPGMFAQALAELFALAARNELRAIVGHTYPLEQAAQAQLDLRARRSTGKLLLDPST